MKFKSLVLIPAYNSRETVSELLSGVSSIKEANEILVVDDGSDDGTYSIVQDKPVKAIRHKSNRGKGAAIKTGFRYFLETDFDAIITLDSDLQHPVEYIPKFENYFKNHYEEIDILMGNRMWDMKPMPLIRRCSNFLSSFTISSLSGLKLPDTQCGFRIIKRWIIEEVTLTTNNFETESELLLKALDKGANCDFIKIPTVYSNNGSKIDNFKDTYRFIRLIINHLRGNLEKESD